MICDHILERCSENDENNNEVFDRLLSDEQKTYIKLFYCQGGLDYSKMKASSKFVMKALVSSLSKKKDATPKEKDMAERRSLFSLRGTCFGRYFYKEKRSKFEWGDICEKGNILG